MLIPEKVLQAILSEQQRQNGRFVPAGTEYFDKLGEYAELVTHQYRGQLLGYIFFYCNDTQKRYSYISLIGTVVAARGTGVGHALLNYVLEITKTRGFAGCRLEVRKDNERARKFYKRAGFVEINDRGDTLLMHRDVNQ